MASEQFRRQLRTESEQWRQEGLISAELQGQLAQRYQFASLEQEASRQFLNILLGLGSILLGLGAITFVAANWQGMAPWFKALVLLGSLVGVNGIGFWLWNSPNAQSRQRWGHALLLLGMLLLGANLGLLPQIFHQSGPVYVLFLLWGVCVALMAAGLRLTSLALSALILLMIGYVSYGFGDFGFWRSAGPQGFWEYVIVYMPLVILGVFLPLAYGCRSRWVFGLGAIALAWTLSSNLAFHSGATPAWLKLALALFLPPALLWSYDARQWRWAGARQPEPARPLPQAVAFRTIARALALFGLGLSLYFLSFRGIWRESWDSLVAFNGNQAPWIVLFDDLLLLVLAKLGWVGLLKQWPGFNQFQLRALNSGFVALLIVGPVALILGTAWGGGLPIFAPFAINLALALMAIGLVRDGLALGLRSCFWAGMVLLVLEIITRMFEYNTGLMLKAFVFMLCGVAVLVAGIWFEKKSQRRRLAQP